MTEKPAYEEMEQRIKTLEKEIVEMGLKNKALRKDYDELVQEMENRTAELIEVNQQLKQEIEEVTVSEQALKISQRLLQTLIDTVEGEMFVKDANGKYLFVNKAYGEDFGVDPEEVIGKDDYFVFSPETAEILQENDQRIMAEKKTVNIEEGTILRGKHVTYLTNKVPLIDDDGNVLGICGVGFDITQQKETEEKLRASEEKYQDLYDNAPDMFVSVDAKTAKILDCNQTLANALGYAKEEIIGQPIFDMYTPESAEHTKTKVFPIFTKTGTIEAEELQLQRKDGSKIDVSLNVSAVRDELGGILYSRSIFRDITKRKKIEQLKADRIYLREEIKLEHNYDNIIGNSDMMQYVLFRAEQIAPTDTTVLILGETGTGKELIARAIHSAGQRKERPLIKIDCASLPANLIESELFGHEKGAFTGAAEKRIGRFELAHGSTLFLDEIGELPLDLQPKLLRVLQDGEFERLGSSQTVRTDIRVIAATNRDLEEDVKQKKFRMDLWYRLNVFAISIPALKDRGKDIALLANYMIKNLEKKHGKQITSIPANILTKLQNYSWPGNVREMGNVIERAVINTQGDSLQLEDALDVYLPAGSESPDRPIKSLAEMEQEHILRVLKNTDWKIQGKNGAADLLDINPSTLRGRMRKHGIQRPPTKPKAAIFGRHI